VSPIAAAQRQALSVFVRAHSAYLALTTWAEQDPRAENDEDEAGSTSTEMAVLIAGLVLLAIAVLAIITRKVLDKVNGISL
jgi:hypothetical protein